MKVFAFDMLLTQFGQFFVCVLLLYAEKRDVATKLWACS